MGVLMNKSEQFAVRIVRLCEYLQKQRREFTLSNQLLRAGTSIGANLAEARFAVSDKDFLSKLYIALKEASETVYWLKLLYRTEYLSKNQYDSINADAQELLKMLSASAKTLKAKQTK